MEKQASIRPQDIVVLLKIVCYQDKAWQGKDLAGDLFLSTAEISNSLKRSVFAGLLSSDKRTVIKGAILEFLQYGVAYAFPVRKGPETKGVPTAYAAPPLVENIVSESPVVWPHIDGTIRGAAIIPLFPKVPAAVLKDSCLYEYLSLVDAIRMGSVREKKLGRELLAEKILGT